MISPQDVAVAIVAVAAVVAALVAMRGKARAMQGYWERSCGGRAWKNAFPDVPKQQIRRFLYLFVDAFAFPRGRILQFLPTDRVIAIYRALYPNKELPDALEVETLADELGKAYGVSLSEIWTKDLTLGDIFSRCVVPAA